jgi:DNA-binding MarR family transcriptional regulator
VTTENVSVNAAMDTSAETDGEVAVVAGLAAAPAAVPAADPATTADGQIELQRAFKRLMIAIRRVRGRETHQHEGLSFAQLELLVVLSGRCAMAGRELAAAANLTPGTVTQMLDPLEAAGLVARRRSETDKRKQMTALTERGRELVSHRYEQMDSRFRNAVAGFTPDELGTAAAVLRQIADSMENPHSDL